MAGQFKNKLAFSALVAILVVAVAMSGRGENGIYSIEVQTVDALLCAPKPQPPIVKAADAACFAAYADGVAEKLRSAQNRKNSYIKGWISRAKRSQDGAFWDVSMRSMGSIPSYICKLSFTDAGQLINHTGNAAVSPVECRYNK